MAPTHYARIEQAILYLDRNAARQPSPDAVARAVRLSPYPF